MAAMRAGWFTALLALLALSCSGEPDAPRAAVPVRPIDCAELHAGGGCELERAAPALSIWVPKTSGKLQRVSARVGGRESSLAFREVGKSPDGVSYQLSFAGQLQGALRVETDRGAGDIALAVPQHWPELEELRSLRREGRSDEAEGKARALVGRARGAVRAHALGVLGRIHLSRDELEPALRVFREAIAADEAAGLLTTAAKDRTALADTLRRRKYALSEAREVLGGIDPRLLEQAGWAAHGLGLVHAEAGNPRSALVELARAGETARALGLPLLALDTAQAIAILLSSLGRHEEAVFTLEGVRSLATDPCDQAHYLTNLGWVRFLSAEQGLGPYDERESLASATLFETQCPDGWGRDNALLNVALVKAARGEQAAALALLERTGQSAEPGLEVALFRGELSAELARAGGRFADALATYDRLVREVGAVSPFASRYRLELGRARCLRALGKTREAVLGFQRAEAALEQQERAIPLGDGRGSFLGGHQAAAVELVELLLEQSREQEAFDTARRARGRLLRSLARWGRLSRLGPEGQARWEDALGRYRQARERADVHAAQSWTVPDAQRSEHVREGDALARAAEQALDVAMTVVDEGVAPDLAEADRPGEAWLLAHPLSSGWAAFLSFEGKVHVARLDALDGGEPARLGPALLDPFAAQLSRATTLRVLAGGAFEAVPVHALPFRDKPLLESLPVVYALDLPGASRGPEAASEKRALVVSDPRRDLPFAEREGRDVAAALAPHFRLGELSGKQATLLALLPRLSEVAWFHFAGHAELSKRGVLRSALSLADGTSLQLSDVLALARVPEVVVLSACEGAKPFDTAHVSAAVASIGLAQSFLLAGSRTALASTARVPDEVAEAMSRALYGAPAFTGQLDATQFQRAALALRARFPEHWSSYRLLVP